MRPFALWFGILVLSLATRAQPVNAQDEWIQQVRTYLEAAAEVFEERGYRPTHDIFTGSLDEGAEEPIRFDLKAGIEYYVMGACDNDCSDLDLILLDANGNEVDSDLLADDAPIVGVTPGGGATYSATVRMVTCSAEPCRYGVGIWGSRAGGASLGDVGAALLEELPQDRAMTVRLVLAVTPDGEVGPVRHRSQ
jgi:hypothetical protein